MTHRKEKAKDDNIQDIQKLRKTGCLFTVLLRRIVKTRKGRRMWPPTIWMPRYSDSRTSWTKGLCSQLCQYHISYWRGCWLTMLKILLCCGRRRGGHVKLCCLKDKGRLKGVIGSAHGLSAFLSAPDSVRCLDRAPRWSRIDTDLKQTEIEIILSGHDDEVTASIRRALWSPDFFWVKKLK